MPYPLVSVPNVSEGRSAASIGAIGAAFSSVATLLDVHSDEDHNRSVFTLAGSPDELEGSLLAGIGEARDRIDLRHHHGVHPRVGAVDVVPVVAVRPQQLEDARELAVAAARRIAAELELPVFLYGDLATGRRLSQLRVGGIGGLQRRIAQGELRPDFGPARLDPAAGCVLVSARQPLVAFNVDLATTDVEIAREIAAVVRETGGGFPGVRALGLPLSSRGLVQVSMNVEDWRLAPLEQVVARIVSEASTRGVEVARAELVGLMPEGAAAAGAKALRLDRLDDSMLLEPSLSRLAS